jgi:hypothetical protein
LHDADAVAVEAAAVAAELAWEDGSSSSSNNPSRLEGYPASFDRRGGWGHDFVVDDACGGEFDDKTGGDVEVDVRDRGVDGSLPASSATSFESVQRLVEMRRLSARETYMAHRKYFDGSTSYDCNIDDISVARDGNDGDERISNGSPGNNGYIDNISVANDEDSPCEDGCIDNISVPVPLDGNHGSGRVFITKKALTLARSLKLDVYDIFVNMKENAFLSDTTVEMAMVTEGDVRDYLDRRYDQLISFMDDYERVDTQKTSKPTFNGKKNIHYERHNNANLGLRRSKEACHRYNWRRSEHIENSRKARPRELPYQRLPQQQQEHHRTIVGSPRLSSNHYGYSQGEDQSFRRGMYGGEDRLVWQADIVRRERPLMLRRPVYEAKSSPHSFGSVPLSKLVSKQRSEPKNSLESRGVSQFRRTSRQNFRNTYRVEQEQQLQRHDVQLKSAYIPPKNRMPEDDVFFGFAMDDGRSYGRELRLKQP